MNNTLLEWLLKQKKECMKVKITYRCPIGPIESDSTEFEVIEDVTIEEYIKKLNSPDDIIKIEVL